MTYFVCLKSWFLFLLFSLFVSKNPFNFFWVVLGGGGVLYIGCPERGEESRKHNFEGDV